MRVSVGVGAFTAGIRSRLLCVVGGEGLGGGASW